MNTRKSVSQCTFSKLLKSWPLNDLKTLSPKKERFELISQHPLRAIKLRLPVWWSQGGSNSRPPACKAGALPAELWPHRMMVGLGGLEPPTSPLSGVRSNHLSYRPERCCSRSKRRLSRRALSLKSSNGVNAEAGSTASAYI